MLTNIVAEKETRVRDQLAMSGLKMPLYWLVHYLFNYMMYAVVVCCLLISGFIFQLRWFMINTFGIYLLLFAIQGHVVIALVSYSISALTHPGFLVVHFF